MGDGDIVLPKINLKALSKHELELFIKELNLPSFRAKQILHWIYERYATSISEITELSKDLREKLSENAYISNLELSGKQVSEDGTEKFLFCLEDGEGIESILIPDEHRLTLCISSQVGCAMNCRFCLTGKMGLKRNLKAYEIVDQVISVSRIRKGDFVRGTKSPLRTITNIVFMGMGEPLTNFDNVTEALWRITEFMKISSRRITLSTSGIVPKILELSKKAPMVNLAISLNATTDAVRDYIMPINKTYPIKQLLDACRKFPLPPRRRITFEYVMLKNINDTTEDAKRLINLLQGIPAKVNLIPFNPYEGSEFERSDDARVLSFQNILLKGHVTALIRKSKGQDIMAACGQLGAKYKLD